MSRTPWVSFDGKDCSGCKHLNERGYCEFTACIIPCMVRATIPEVKPQIYSTNRTNSAIDGEKRTNGDRIRSMTDEELAEWIPNFVIKCQYPDECGSIDCAKCVMVWLKQEAE